MRIIRAFALAVLASVVLAATACSMQQSTTSVTADSQAAETGTSSEDTSMSEQTKAATEQNRGARSGAFDMVNKKVRLNSGYDMPIMGLGTYSLDRKAHGVSSAQVILRWDLQRGIVVIPGSSNPDHIKENLDLFGFELSDEEMARINALDRNEKHDWY